MPVTGSYCFSMASNYNGNPRPAVLLVNDGRARVIVERKATRIWWHDSVRCMVRGHQ